MPSSALKKVEIAVTQGHAVHGTLALFLPRLGAPLWCLERAQRPRALTRGKVPLFVECIVFFNDTATTEIYTLSLHDALPICSEEIRYYCSLLPIHCR